MIKRFGILTISGITQNKIEFCSNFNSENFPCLIQNIRNGSNLSSKIQDKFHEPTPKIMRKESGPDLKKKRF